MLCQTALDDPPSYQKFEGGDPQTEDQWINLQKEKDLDLLHQLSEGDQDFKDYLNMLQEARKLYIDYKNLGQDDTIQKLPEKLLTTIINELELNIESLKQDNQASQKYKINFLKQDIKFLNEEETLKSQKDSNEKEEEQALIPDSTSKVETTKGEEKNHIYGWAQASKVTRETIEEIENKPVEVHEIIWEPSKLSEKFLTFLHGSAEAIFICFLGSFCLQIPSAVSVSFFVIANLLQFTMVFDISYRYFYGLIALSINLLCVISIVIAKIVYLKKSQNFDFKNYTKQTEFLSEIKLLQSLGFQLICNQEKLKPCDKIKLFDKNNNKLEFTININSVGSFNLEIVFLFMIFVFGIYMLVQYLKINKLLKTPWKDIYNYRQLEKELLQKKDDDDDEDEKTEKKEDLGTAQKKNIQQQKDDQQKLKEVKEQYKKMSENIPKNFVQSSFYYNLNTRFFMISFFFTVVAALTAKSMLDVPSFILILGMCGGYMVRKKISFVYTTYCYFLMYYISFIMLIKICHDCIISISFIQTYLNNPKNITQKNFNLIIFGSLMFREENIEPNPNLERSKQIYTASLFYCFFFTLCWKNAKWMEIREKTEEEDVNFVSRFIKYIYVRVAEDQQIKKVREQQFQGNEQSSEESSKKKDKLKEIRPKRKLYDEISKKLKKTQDKTTITKLYILWTARFLMALLAYMYHSTAGLLNLVWVITSFIFPEKYVYLFSIVFMIPVILLEFILIYSNKVAVIKNSKFFLSYGGYFQWKMVTETYECCLFFLVLALFFFMIGTYFDTVDKNEDTNELLQFLKIRIQNKKYSSFWRYLFVFFGSIHKILLIFLFFKSLNNFNNAKNMGSLILFILFISSAKFYRKAGFLLLWFFAFFIIAQYYFSLCWVHFLTPQHNVPIFYWLTFFPGKLPEQNELYTQNPFSEQLRPQLYFGFSPNLTDWFILLIVNLVGTINDIFRDEKTVNKLFDEIQETFEQQNQTLIYYFRRISNVLNIIFLFVINIFMIIVQLMLAETNLIMWIFFLLSILGLGQLIRANRSIKEIQKSITISKIIKYYSCFVLVLTILFIAMVGEFRKDKDIAYSQSVDYKLSLDSPVFYKLIPYIGLRSIKYKNIHFSMSEAEKRDAQFQLSKNIFFQVFILLVSSYLEQYFKDQKKLITKDNEIFDEDYQKIFEYVDQNKNEEKNTHKAIKDLDLNIKLYTQKYFIDFYEGQRFTKPFLAYRLLNYWDKIDTICTYGHLVNNFLIFYIALFRNLSIYLFVNLTFILGFYVLAGVRTSRRAKLNQQVSGLQSQVDVAMGKLITKKHKTEAFREFLKLRIRVWYFQFIAFFFALLIGYPTSLLSNFRQDAFKEASGLDTIEQGHTAFHARLDSSIFWFFFTGVFKDETSDDFVQKNQFYIDFLIILFGLFIERNMINWLKDRLGCSYYKFQKFIELDIRRNAIRQGWQNQNPEYNVERYRQHYFLNDFEDLKQKFFHINYAKMIEEKNKRIDFENELMKNQNQQLMSNALAKTFFKNFARKNTIHFPKLNQSKIDTVFSLAKTKLELKYEKNNYGDFISAKEGMRIYNMIKHCLELECQATHIILDQQSLELLQERLGPNNQNLKEFFKQKLDDLNQIKADEQQNLNYRAYIDRIHHLVLKISQTPSVVVTQENEQEIKLIPSLSLKDFNESLGKLNKENAIKEKQDEEISILQRISQSQSVDYEGVPILRKYKTDQLRKILKDNIDFKYAVSFAKGNQIIFEGIILFMIMLSLCLKCNIFSIVYMLFLIRYPQVASKSGYMVRLSCYMAVVIFINYAFLLFNLTQNISPRKFPKPFQNYPDWDQAVDPLTKPKDQTQFYWENEKDRLNDGTNWKLVYPIPFAFQISAFRRDLLFCYLMGMGIDSQQIYSILIDLITIYIVAMYTVTYRNPILSTKMKKVFWQFPQKNQSGYQDRLEPETRKLVDFIYQPVALYNQQIKKKEDKKLPLNSQEEKDKRNEKYQTIQLPKGYKEDLSIQQFNFIGEYRKSMKIQLNNTLTNYVDITYDAVWSEEFIKEKKREIKNNSVYFRLVKRGSVLIYLTFHIITILVILLMSVTRQSLLSLGYILILLPSIKDGAEVLKQRELKIELTIKKKQEEMINLSKYFPNMNDRADIEGSLQKEKPKGKEKQIQQDIVEHFLKKDDQISIELQDTLKQLDHSKDPQAQILLDGARYPEFLEMLKSNQDIRGKSDFQGKRYEAMLLLFVHSYTKKFADGSNEKKTFIEDRQKIIKIDNEIKELNRQLQARKLKEIQKGINKKQKSLEWKFIGTMKNALLTYSLLDFLLSILYQLPTPYTSSKDYGMGSLETIIGLTKIFVFPNHASQGELKARNLFSKEKGNLSLELNVDNLITQAFNCFIIAFILIQNQIFESTGYQKYINQDNGSMDLLVQLSELKAKSMTYVFNNMKIRKITSVQKHKEKLVAVVENIKGKLQKWRKANRNLLKLSNPDTVQNKDENEKLLLIQKALATYQADSKNSRQVKDEELFELFKKALVTLVKDQEKPKKSVKFDEEVNAKEEQKQLEVMDDEVHLREHKIPSEEISEKTDQLIEQLLAQKMKKRGACVNFYLWLHESFTEQILFKNEKSELEEILKSHASGEIKTPTELEKLMRTELKELVKIHLDSKENNKKFQIAIHKLKKNPEKNTLLEITEMDKNIKFNDMKMSFEFTRSFAMIINYFETLFCIVVSQSEAFIYFGMIFSMYMNAGLISLYYPIAAFGYGMLEEKRTGKVFWRWIRWYTTAILLFKFVVTLRIAKENFFDGETWKDIQAYTLFGVLSAEDGITSTFYMLPEIIIICFIMLNEIKLKLLGLYEDRELDIEQITDGIIRIRCKGDEQQIKQRLALQSHSAMEPLMTSCQEKKKIDQQYFASKKRQIQMDLTKKQEKNKNYLIEIYDNPDQDFCVALELQKQNKDKNYDCMDNEGFNQLKKRFGKNENFKQSFDQFTQNSLKDEQLKAFKDVSSMMWNTALTFDLDSTGKKTLSDELIKQQTIQKTLENDFVCFVEGYRRPTQIPFPTEQEFASFKYEEKNWENMSCGDYEEETGEKFDQLSERKKDAKSFFDSNPYFDTLFPSLKIQKPGGDWYGCTTLTLSFIAIYIFMFFEKYTFDITRFPFMKKESSLLTGESSITVIGIIIIIILERIANRTDTKSADPEKLDLGKKGQDKKNFQQDDFIARSTTVRSLTVKLQKTQKTADLDLNDQGTQNFLENLEMDEEEIDRARTRITKQQKYKYFIHLFMLIGGHIYIFWYIPLKFNTQLHGSPRCNKDNDYGCMNFHSNGYLRGLYILLIIYLIFSSIQLSQGMPLKRKASSVLQYYNDLGKIGSDIFAAIPFAIELRATIDYCCSKTSLDFFQTLQLYYYHYFFYTSMLGNRYYIEKKVGEKQQFGDKFLCGYLSGAFILTLMLGTLYLFSTYSVFIALNPIDTASLKFNFVISNTIVIDENTRTVVRKYNENQFKNEHKVISNMTYNLYINQNPSMKTLSQNEFSDRYKNATMLGHSAQSEHLAFAHDQVQDMLVPTYSESKWDLSSDVQKYLFKDLSETLNDFDRPDLLNFTLQYDFGFGRAGPVGSEKTNAKINRTLNATNYFDCLTAQELRKMSSLQCNSKNKNTLYTSAIFSKAFIPQIVLGQTKQGTELVLSQFKEEDQKLDIKITYFCNQTWKIEGKNGTTDKKLLMDNLKNLTITENLDDYLIVDDTKNCGLAHQRFKDKAINESRFKEEINNYREKGQEKNILKFQDSQGNEKVEEFILDLSWGKLKFVIFSMLIVTGFIAGSSPTGFLGGIVYLAYLSIKPIFMLLWADANLYEGTHHMPLIKLCEAVYMYRHEEDLVNEESTYRMIQEIVRSSEFLKGITGSSLRGDLDPLLDKLDETQKERLKHLMKLEAKGFDVEELKKKIIKTDPNPNGESLFNQDEELK